MIVMGVDPGLARVGIGVVRGGAGPAVPLGYECITSSGKDRTASERLAGIYDRLVALFDRFSPDELAVEQLFFARNVTSAMGVAEVRGVVLLAAGMRGLPVAEYTPNQVKLAVTGSGKADKRQVQEMIARLLGLPGVPEPDDAADALAIALCHLHTRGE